MWTKLLGICLFLLSMSCPIEGLRILVVFPMTSKSHNILGQGVVNNLLEAGHEVVFLTAFPRTKPVVNLTEVDCSPIGAEFRKEVEKSEQFKLKNFISKGNIEPVMLSYVIYVLHKELLEFEPLINFLSDPNEKFDLVIMEWFFSETVVGIPPLFQCPFIWIGSTEAHGPLLRLIDEVSNPAYSADLFSTNAPPFSFLERAEELYFAVKRMLINIVAYPFEKYLYNRVFPELAAKRGVTMPSYDEAAFNASMILLNSHPSLGTPYKLPQNVKYIGGYHIDRKVKPLPNDLQHLMDKSKHGVIYFSMGSNVQSKDMSTEMKASLLEMFGKLKEDIIWKFEDSMENVPANVHLIKWAPQPSILAHPNLKLFITHGGQLSTTESIHFGVPVVGLPVFGDQYINMRSVVNKGFGVMVKLSEGFTDDLRDAIQKVIGNPEYEHQAKRLSAIYHDRMAIPGEELVYWAEHVVRTGGAPHLKSPAFSVPWYQKMYLDLTAVLILIVFLVYKTAKVVLRKWRGGKEKKQKRN